MDISCDYVKITPAPLSGCIRFRGDFGRMRYLSLACRTIMAPAGFLGNEDLPISFTLRLANCNGSSVT